MAKNFYIDTFTAPQSYTYSSSGITFAKRAQISGGYLTAPKPTTIPYLEQGFGVILPNCVYISDTHIYVVGTTAAVTMRVNRFLRSNLAFDGFITLTTDATGNKTPRDLIVLDGIAGERILVGFTSATATAGGLAYCYGITAADWTGGTTFAVATSSFTSRVTLCLAQNATNTLQNITSIALASPSSMSSINSGVSGSCTLYIMQTTNTALLPMFMRLDLGATLGNPTSGRIALADSFRLGMSTVMTGDIATNLPQAAVSQLRYVTPGANHPVGVSGVPALFFTRGTTTASRIGRITGTTFVSGLTVETDFMTEIPPLGTSVQSMGGSMSALAYDSENDYFHTVCTTAVLPKRDYKFVYNPGAAMTQSYGPGGCIEGNPVAYAGQPVWATHTTVRCGFAPGSGSAPGMLVLARQAPGTTQGQQLMVLDVGADKCSAILPAISTPNAVKFYDAYINRKTPTAYAGASESVQLYYRTAGISDNSGSWTQLLMENDLTGVTASSQIQFKIEFNILGGSCVPTLVDNLLVVWEDGNSTDSHYEPSMNYTDVSGLTFAWRQGTSWGMTIPTMRFRLYNVANNLAVIDDHSSSPAFGTWQYSTDGSVWSAWSTSADSVGNYIRYSYTGTAIGGSITGRALLTQE
jgi:hypothetical protein